MHRVLSAMVAVTVLASGTAPGFSQEAPASQQEPASQEESASPPPATPSDPNAPMAPPTPKGQAAKPATNVGVPDIIAPGSDGQGSRAYRSGRHTYRAYRYRYGYPGDEEIRTKFRFPHYAAAPVAAGTWESACARKYRSFDPRSYTFLGRDGRRYRCVLP